MRFPSRSWEPKHRRNGKIRAREVRVIDDAKQQLGVMTLTDALRLAQSKGMDLIETIERACAKYQRVTGKGIPEFAGPLLEHKPTRDDDIPF